MRTASTWLIWIAALLVGWCQPAYPAAPKAQPIVIKAPASPIPIGKLRSLAVEGITEADVAAEDLHWYPRPDGLLVEGVKLWGGRLAIYVMGDKPGTYQIWLDCRGDRYGEVEVQIGESGPTPADPPMATLTVDAESGELGSMRILGWHVVPTLATVSIDGQPVASSGTRTVNPTVETTYTLIATTAGGTVRKSVTAKVTAPKSRPDHLYVIYDENDASQAVAKVRVDKAWKDAAKASGIEVECVTDLAGATAYPAATKAATAFGLPCVVYWGQDKRPTCEKLPATPTEMMQLVKRFKEGLL